jgi:sulfotransferase
MIKRSLTSPREFILPGMQKIHFISGLPRSGSTLLAALLRQNPRFHASMTSPVAPLINSALEQMGANSEFYPFFSTEKRKSVSRALFDAYYEDKAEKNVIFDTNRIWTARLHQLVELFGDFKMICCVRNPAWILDSFERIYRKNPFDYSRMFNAENRLTVYSRCDAMMNTGGVVGSAWTALKEAYYGDFSGRLLLVDYDLLAQRPVQAMELIYRFIDEPEFGHDVNNVEYEEGEFDQQLGVKGLHTVKRKVGFSPRRTILPPDLFERFCEMDFWRDISGTSANLITPKN